jgi:hypothetical protein
MTISTNRESGLWQLRDAGCAAALWRRRKLKASLIAAIR